MSKQPSTTFNYETWKGKASNSKTGFVKMSATRKKLRGTVKPGSMERMQVAQNPFAERIAANKQVVSVGVN